MSTYEVEENSNSSKNLKVMAIMTGGTIFMKRDEQNHLEVRENNDNVEIEVEIEPMCNLKDSSDMSFADWNSIGRKINDNYKKFNGFVVLYGTDTMTQAACALSFMLENLAKPVVFTGSQIPIFEARNDGLNNFISSIIIAGTSRIPEVVICFNNKVFRGNRCVKVDSQHFDAFESPSIEPLAVLGVYIEYNSKLFQPASEGIFELVQMESKNILTVTLNPATDTEQIKSIMADGVQGAVVRSYGCGNGPSKVAEELNKLAQQKVIVIVSQCLHTKVTCEYKTGLLQDRVIVSGNDLTPEAAFAKLSYLMTKYPDDVDRQRELMTTCLRGEMS
ncbi:hypothetical protein Btru_021327 [Bulinus truncatus]|nr:hypothetical protein Btru_021327 [Bulinus truncatus]